jgi:heme-degrading monooxygenase HmoA
MHARIVRFSLGPGTADIAERLADEAWKLYRKSPGFESVTFFYENADAGQYGSFSTWESKETLEAAAAALLPVLQKMVGGSLKAPPQTSTWEIYQPKS